MLDDQRKDQIEYDAIVAFVNEAARIGIVEAYSKRVKKYNDAIKKRGFECHPATPVRRNINEVYGLVRQEAGRV